MVSAGEPSTSRALLEPLAFDASPEVREAIEGIARTEDIAFSPSGRRLGIAAFHRDRVLLFDLDKERRLQTGDLALTGRVEIAAHELHEPHGLTFLDEETIIVANRLGSASVYRLPPANTGASESTLAPLQTLDGEGRIRLDTPGSVAARHLRGSRCEVLICNNYRHDVSRHVLDRRAQYRVRSDRLLLNAGLDIPDGVAISPDGRWIAVSNHSTHSVLMFAKRLLLNPRTTPAGSLLDVECPHGLQFSADGRRLYVASAASPYVHVYAGEDGRRVDWRGERRPVASARVLDDETFLKGRYNPEEGGPKGLDLSGELNLLAITCEHLPLAFFDLTTFVHP